MWVFLLGILRIVVKEYPNVSCCINIKIEFLIQRKHLNEMINNCPQLFAYEGYAMYSKVTYSQCSLKRYLKNKEKIYMLEQICTSYHDLLISGVSTLPTEFSAYFVFLLFPPQLIFDKCDKDFLN